MNLTTDNTGTPQKTTGKKVESNTALIDRLDECRSYILVAIIATEPEMGERNIVQDLLKMLATQLANVTADIDTAFHNMGKN